MLQLQLKHLFSLERITTEIKNDLVEYYISEPQYFENAFEAAVIECVDCFINAPLIYT